MKARSAISIQRDVIFAIFLREMNARFKSYTFGNIWIILEPLLMISVFLVLFGARGRGEFGYVEPPVFILAGFLPFRTLWQATMRKNMSALGGAKGLLGFRQVRLFDIFMARSLVEGGIFLVSGTALVLIMMWLGFAPLPNDPLFMLFYAAHLWLFAIFFGILACVIASIAREVEKLVNLFTMPLMFVSAVFYPMTIVPARYQDLMALNPLVHASELIREAWLPGYISPVASYEYLFVWILILSALAVSAYRLRWQRMLAR
ncbi:ABC transporter permease [Kordiimonas pumila]|uniref:Transport permease protein n=1 Tax=Kordiimonas pumila TaxID=2161677 RepID=A0ABV7D4N9_9PROT|nr:ABC transporter permease [Kordiimonas pumila]